MTACWSVRGEACEEGCGCPRRPGGPVGSARGRDTVVWVHGACVDCVQSSPWKRRE